MKTLVKIFVIAFVAITMSTLTSCSTQRALSRAIENGEYELSTPSLYVTELIKESHTDHYYVLLEDVKTTKIEAKKGDPEIFGYVFVEMKLKSSETGETFEAYSYYTAYSFGSDVEKAKKGQKIRAVIEKDSKGKHTVLASEFKL